MAKISKSSFESGIGMGVREANVSGVLDKTARAKSRTAGVVEDFAFEYEKKKKAEEGRQYQMEAMNIRDNDMNSFHKLAPMFLDAKGNLDLDREIDSKDPTVGVTTFGEQLKLKQFNRFSGEFGDALRNLNTIIPDGVPTYDIQGRSYSDLTGMKHQYINGKMAEAAPYQEAYEAFSARTNHTNNNEVINAKNFERKRFVESAIAGEKENDDRALLNIRENNLSLEDFNDAIKRNRSLRDSSVGSFHTLESANASNKKFAAEALTSFAEGAMERGDKESVNEARLMVTGSATLTPVQLKALEKYQFIEATAQDLADMDPIDAAKYSKKVDGEGYVRKALRITGPEDRAYEFRTHEAEGSLGPKERESLLHRLHAKSQAFRSQDIMEVHRNIQTLEQAVVHEDLKESYTKDRIQDLMNSVKNQDPQHVSDEEKQRQQIKILAIMSLDDAKQAFTMKSIQDRAKGMGDIKKKVMSDIEELTKVNPDLGGFGAAKSSVNEVMKSVEGKFSSMFRGMDKAFKADPAKFVLDNDPEAPGLLSKAELSGNPEDTAAFFRHSIGKQLMKGSNTPRYYNKDASQMHANEFMNAIKSDDGGLALQRMQDKYGGNIFNVFQEMANDGFIKKEMVAPSAIADIGVKNDILSMLRNRGGEDGIEKTFQRQILDSKVAKKSDVMAAVNTEMAEFRGDFARSGFGRSEFAGQFNSLVLLRTKELMVSDQMSASDAAEMAKEEIVDGSFTRISDNLMAHKKAKYDEQDVESLVKHYTNKPENLGRFNIRIEEGVISDSIKSGISKNRLDAIERQHIAIARKAVWKTSPGMDGMVLKYPSSMAGDKKSSGWITIRDSDGAPVEIKYKNARKHVEAMEGGASIFFQRDPTIESE